MGDRDPKTAQFEVHRDEQRRRWRSLSARERLAWLEEAKRFVARALGATRPEKAGRRR